MTPFEAAGYSRDTKFRVLRDIWNLKEGELVTLDKDDGSKCPIFKTKDGREGWFWLPNMSTFRGHDWLEVYKENNYSGKAILFNGPAKVGKDVALQHVIARYSNGVIKETKDHLHKLTQTFFNVSEEEYYSIYNNRDMKEKPQPCFSLVITREDFGLFMKVLGIDSVSEEYDWCFSHFNFDKQNYSLSIREAMIYVSEILVKPRLGVDYFGKARADSVNEKEDLVFDASASAFKVGNDIVADELPPLIDKLGEDNVLLIRVHREGYTFEGDSRFYIPDGVVNNTLDVYNDGTLEEFFSKVDTVVNKFLGG